MADLLVEVADGVAVLTLNRPDVRNAISATLAAEVADAADAAAADENVRVVVIRGAGPAFSSGYDLGAWRRQRCSRPSGGRRRRPPPGPYHQPLGTAMGLPAPGDRPGTRPLPGRWNGPRPALRPRRRRRRRPHRLPAGPVSRRPTGPHVALPPGPAVDQAASLHRRHDHGPAGGRGRLRPRRRRRGRTGGDGDGPRPPHRLLGPGDADRQQGRHQPWHRPDGPAGAAAGGQAARRHGASGPRGPGLCRDGGQTRG